MKKQYMGILQGRIDELNEAKKKAKEESGPVMQAVATAKAERDEAVASRDAARKEAEAAMQAVAAAKKEMDEAVASRDAARAEAEAAMQEAETIKKERDDATANRDAARREADELRRTKVEQAQQAAVEASKAMRDRIETNTRKAWDAWLEKKKAKAEATAAEIVAAAVEAVQGDFAPFIKWLSAQTYKSGANAGKSWFQGLFGMFQNEVLAKRLKAMPSDVRGAGQRQAGADRDAPVK